jgi:hypothetical protein
VLRKVRYRIYEDFFMRSRLPRYRDVLRGFLDVGYEFVTHGTYVRSRRGGSCLARHSIVLRHDIDTDVVTAKRMRSIERDLGIQSSYFFRLSTLDVPFMKQLAADGCEASYHYEELSTLAKRIGARSGPELLAQVARARDEFRRNVVRLREETGLPIDVIVPHGDFMNRRLGVFNKEVVNAELRDVLGVTDIYEQDLAAGYDSTLSDCGPPRYWYPQLPRDVLSSRPRVLHMVVHPKHWRANLGANLAELAARVGDECRVRARRRRGS